MSPARPPRLSRLPRLSERARIGLLLLPALTVVGVFFVGGVAQGLLQSLGRQPLVGTSDWSFDAYLRVLEDPAFRASLLLTLRVSVVSTAAATVLGVALALVVRRFGGRGAMTTLFQSTLAVPHLVGALCIGLLLSPSGLFSRIGHLLGLSADANAFPLLVNDGFGWGIIAEYTWKETPFIAVVALAAMTRNLVDLEELARTLGATPLRRLRSVTLPLLAPPVAAASVLVFAFAAASYEVPRLLGRPFPATLPVVAFERFQDPDLTLRPEAMALATILALLTLLMVAAYFTLVSRLSRRTL